MSTAITSAPSWANRTACARPCPRAAPVTSTTFPSTLPAMTDLLVSWVRGHLNGTECRSCRDERSLGKERRDRRRHVTEVSHPDQPAVADPGQVPAQLQIV